MVVLSISQYLVIKILTYGGIILMYTSLILLTLFVSLSLTNIYLFPFISSQ